MKDLFSKIFRGGLMVAEAVVEENVDNIMKTEQVLFKTCESNSLEHALRGNNRGGDFFISIHNRSMYSMHSSITITTEAECAALIDCLTEMKEALT